MLLMVEKWLKGDVAELKDGHIIKHENSKEKS